MKPSMYDSAWAKLKNNPDVPLVIAAHKALHRRIYKAIIKRKYEDQVWHYTMLELDQKSTLSRVSTNDRLEIRLKIVSHIPLERLF